jgi:hypothetical protein
VLESDGELLAFLFPVPTPVGALHVVLVYHMYLWFAKIIESQVFDNNMIKLPIVKKARKINFPILTESVFLIKGIRILFIFPAVDLILSDKIFIFDFPGLIHIGNMDVLLGDPLGIQFMRGIH